MIDYGAILYDPIYAELGVPASLKHATHMLPVFQANIFQQDVFQVTSFQVSQITVIDNTRAKTTTTGPLDVRSAGPGAYARIPELTAKGIGLPDCETLAFNGRTWIIRNSQPRGSPNGEDQGEVHFALREQ